MTGDPKAALRAAWDDMLASLQRARDAVDDPALYPPPPGDRTLAEGYRYLLGFGFSAIERAFFEDPRFPYIRRAIQPIDRSTIDNSDALYLCAPIDGEESYWLRGNAADHRHWRGEPPAPSGRRAPQYFIVEATTAYAGDSGNLAELSTAVRANTGKTDCSLLAVNEDGTFEILLAPEKPAGYDGNFIATKKLRRWTAPDGAPQEKEHTAHWLTIRELFGDWEAEDPLELSIVRVGSEGEHPAPLDADAAARMMRRAGEIAENQMRFWNEFYAVVLETYEDMNGDGVRFMPRNAFNDPAGASVATGGGQSTNVYAGGVFELADDEALIVTVTTPDPPAYMGFALSNLWGESTDYANHVSSLNSAQAEPDDDGAFRYVIAHRDPGVPNWVDTTGLAEGFMAQRWTYALARKAERPPSITAELVPFDKVRDRLPPDTRTVSPKERREQIRVRQEHVQRRFRQY